MKNFLSSVTDKLMYCLLVFSLALAFGNVILITFGFAKVDIIRKNNNKKNIISLKDEVATSA
jgi:peroxiredoxin family protein